MQEGRMTCLECIRNWVLDDVDDYFASRRQCCLARCNEGEIARRKVLYRSYHITSLTTCTAGSPCEKEIVRAQEGSWWQSCRHKKLTVEKKRKTKKKKRFKIGKQREKISRGDGS